MKQAIRSALPWLKAQARRPLGIALLSAVLVHGLLLTHARMRGSRHPQPLPAQAAADDTPELLRFSRRAPLETPLSTIPLPPPSLLPPPAPPTLPPAARPGRARKQTGARGAAAVSSKPLRSAGRGAQVTPGQRPPTARARPRSPVGATAVASTSQAAPAGPSQLQTARESLEALRRQPGGDSPEASELLPLWQEATAVEAADLPRGLELRRLPAGRARELGLVEGQRRAVRTQAQLLVIWLEGEQAWLLQDAAARGEGAGAG